MKSKLCDLCANLRALCVKIPWPLALLAGFVLLVLATGPLRSAEGTLVRLNNIAQLVSSPLITNVSTNVITLFATNLAQFDGRVILRTVENVSTVPILYSINNTNVTITNFHGILAGGNVARDGLGSVLDLSNVPFPVSFVTESATGVLAIVELTQ